VHRKSPCPPRPSQARTCVCCTGCAMAGTRGAQHRDPQLEVGFGSGVVFDSFSESASSREGSIKCGNAFLGLLAEQRVRDAAAGDASCSRSGLSAAHTTDECPSPSPRSQPARTTEPDVSRRRCQQAPPEPGPGEASFRVQGFGMLFCSRHALHTLRLMAVAGRTGTPGKLGLRACAPRSLPPPGVARSARAPFTW
jgi:hypothetical protein